MSSRPIDLDELRALRSGLVVYVGPALTRAAGLPTPPELARLLLDALPEGTTPARQRAIASRVERGELTDAFTEFERDLTPARLGLEVERALSDRGVDVPPLGRVLAQLGPRIDGVITPNLDRMMERAFGAQLVTHVRPSSNLVQRRGWLLKINGTLPDRSSWVLTREQRARVSWRDPVHAQVLGALLLGRHILFVGTALDDPIFTAIIDQVQGLSEGAPARHWALLERAELDGPARTKLADAGICPLTYDSDHELLTVLASLAPDPAAVELPPPPRRRTPSGPVRILFASASPWGVEALAVDREQRIIRAALERATQRDRIELVTRVAVSYADLSRALLEAEYDIVHIASHGEQLGVILDGGGRAPVAHAELMALFDEHAPPRGRLRCVVFNSCWSREAARVPSQVHTRITMEGTIDDRAALAFSEGFYDAIGAGRAFDVAFREGRRRATSAAPGCPFAAELFVGS